MLWICAMPSIKWTLLKMMCFSLDLVCGYCIVQNHFSQHNTHTCHEIGFGLLSSITTYTLWSWYCIWGWSFQVSNLQLDWGAFHLTSSMGIALNKALWLNMILAQTTYVDGVLVIDCFERYYIDETRNKVKRINVFMYGRSWHNKKKVNLHNSMLHWIKLLTRWRNFILFYSTYFWIATFQSCNINCWWCWYPF